MLLQIGTLAQGFGVKLNRQIFEADLERALASRPAPGHGTVQIVGQGIPSPPFRAYEGNYLLFRAWDDVGWWTRIDATADSSFAVPPWLDADDVRHAYVFEGEAPSCATTVKVDARGYGRFDAIIGVLPGVRAGVPGVRIVESSTSCR